MCDCDKRNPMKVPEDERKAIRECLERGECDETGERYVVQR